MDSSVDPYCYVRDVFKKMTPIVNGSLKYSRAIEQTAEEGGEGLEWLLYK